MSGSAKLACLIKKRGRAANRHVRPSQATSWDEATACKMRLQEPTLISVFAPSACSRTSVLINTPHLQPHGAVYRSEAEGRSPQIWCDDLINSSLTEIALQQFARIFRINTLSDESSPSAQKQKSDLSAEAAHGPRYCGESTPANEEPAPRREVNQGSLPTATEDRCSLPVRCSSCR